MKKIIVIVALLTSCKSSSHTIRYSKSINKCINNLEEMEKWLIEDFESGDIPIYIANNYILILQDTKNELNKNKIKLNTITNR